MGSFVYAHAVVVNKQNALWTVRAPGNSVGVAISRRRYRSRKNSTPTLDIDQLLRRGNHFSRKNDCHSLIFVYLCIEFTAAGALLVGFIYMKVIHPINGWEGEAPSMIIHH